MYGLTEEAGYPVDWSLRINNQQETYTAMNESNVVELKAPVEDALGELLKEGARQLLAQAIEAEVAELLIQYADQTVNGKRAVVRNGYLPERSIQTGLGEVPVKVPKVRDRSDGGIKVQQQAGAAVFEADEERRGVHPLAVPEGDLDRGDAARTGGTAG